MSYLSRRMREDGWPQRNPGEVTVTLLFDVPKTGLAFGRASQAAADAAKAVADFARQFADVELDPWQERMIAAAFADPDAMRRLADPPARHHRSVLVTSTPADSHSEILAELRDRVARGARLTLRPDPANPPPDERATRLAWEVVDEVADWHDAGERERVDREHLGIWPTPRERE